MGNISMNGKKLTMRVKKGIVSLETVMGSMRLERGF
jgi:hypothetical protein